MYGVLFHAWQMMKKHLAATIFLMVVVFIVSFFIGEIYYSQLYQVVDAQAVSNDISTIDASRIFDITLNYNSYEECTDKLTIVNKILDEHAVDNYGFVVGNPNSFCEEFAENEAFLKSKEQYYSNIYEYDAFYVDWYCYRFRENMNEYLNLDFCEGGFVSDDCIEEGVVPVYVGYIYKDVFPVGSYLTQGEIRFLVTGCIAKDSYLWTDASNRYCLDCAFVSPYYDEVGTVTSAATIFWLSKDLDAERCSEEVSRIRESLSEYQIKARLDSYQKNAFNMLIQMGQLRNMIIFILAMLVFIMLTIIVEAFVEMREVYIKQLFGISLDRLVWAFTFSKIFPVSIAILIPYCVNFLIGVNMESKLRAQRAVSSYSAVNRIYASTGILVIFGGVLALLLVVLFFTYLSMKYAKRSRMINMPFAKVFRYPYSSIVYIFGFSFCIATVFYGIHSYMDEMRIWRAENDAVYPYEQSIEIHFSDKNSMTNLVRMCKDYPGVVYVDHIDAVIGYSDQYRTRALVINNQPLRLSLAAGVGFEQSEKTTYPRVMLGLDAYSSVLDHTKEIVYIGAKPYSIIGQIGVENTIACESENLLFYEDLPNEYLEALFPHNDVSLLLCNEESINEDDVSKLICNIYEYDAGANIERGPISSKRVSKYRTTNLDLYRVQTGILSLIIGTLGCAFVSRFLIMERKKEFCVRMSYGQGKKAILWLILRDLIKLSLVSLAICGIVYYGWALVCGHFLYELYGLDLKMVLCIIFLAEAVAVVSALATVFELRTITPAQLLKKVDL